MNRLEELGAVQYSVADNQEEVDKLSKTLIDLHQSRWESEGKPGVFSSDKYRSFHSRIMSTALERGWLRLGALKLDDNYLACEYNFSFNNKIYSYQSGVNIFKEWNLSIGTIADVYAIGNAISDGSAEYDFLAGASDYKVRLSKGEHHIVTIRVGKPSLKETLYQAAKRLKRFARRRVRRGS
jgi:CelD/BcsL family acetyltransferase involved in cellulose biosynthesis